MKKILASLTVGLVIALVIPAVALAHVVVTPNHAAIGDNVRFNVGVPNEKQVAVSSLKLTLPPGLKSVQPDVMAGWQITTARDSSGNVTTITWSGSIPAGQRADFAFKAQAPAKAGNLDWKAYQTYADGSVVSWDQNPATSGKAVKNDAGPYSITKVVNDLGPNSSSSSNDHSKTAALALIFSISALIFSLGGLFLRRRR